MIGGTVIEVILMRDRVWINCEENKSTSRCAIYVERNSNSEKIKRADSIWWQGRYALWTPFEIAKTPPCNHAHHYSCRKVGVEYDIKIPRIGYSGVERPEPCGMSHDGHCRSKT